MSGTTQEIITWTVSHLRRLLHGLPSKRCGVSSSNITGKSMSEFSLNVKDGLAMTQGTI